MLCEYKSYFQNLITKNIFSSISFTFVSLSLVISCIIFESQLNTPLRYLLITPSCIYIISMLFSLEFKISFEKFVFIKLTSFIGLFSYSLYAIHEPFLYFLKSFFLIGQPSVFFFPTIIFATSSIFISFAFFLVFENPFLAKTSQFTFPTRYKLYNLFTNRFSKNPISKPNDD